MARPGNQSDDQPFTTFDRDREQPRIALLSKLGKHSRELRAGVLDHPGLDRHAVVVEETHAVNS
jgi:hypothetical protein